MKHLAESRLKEAVMFKESFVPDDRRLGQKAWVFPLSLAVHAAIVSALVILPLLGRGDLPRFEVKAAAFLTVPPPPSPPPPPRKTAGARAGRIKPVLIQAAAEAGKLIAPVQIPDEIAEEPLRDAGADGGVDGGVDGGIPGGALDAVIGPLLNVVLGQVEAPVRAAGEIKQPRRIRAVEPAYPEIARQARVEGIVIIEAETDVYGRVQRLRVLRSIPLLDQAALDAVRQWLYEPLIIGGRPRGVVFTVTVRFTLKSTQSTPRAEARGMLRVNTERRFLPQFKNRDFAPANV
jgi:protein TonB